MIGRNVVETVLGAVVLIVAVLFVYLFYQSTQIRTVEGYRLTATFASIGGLNKGSDVRISGIKVGTVVDQSLDSKTYNAVVTLSLASHVKLPVDTVAAIANEGILGGKYVRLEPGRERETLPPGGAIKRSKDYRSLEDQVGEIIFLATGGDSGGARK
jgi:phospholipid/cholesterol/gamma-HCH transport system substrate-binding protein